MMKKVQADKSEMSMTEQLDMRYISELPIYANIVKQIALNVGSLSKTFLQADWYWKTGQDPPKITLILQQHLREKLMDYLLITHKLKQRRFVYAMGIPPSLKVQCIDIPFPSSFF